MNKIAVLGTSVSTPRFHELKNKAVRMGVELDLIPYNRMHFRTDTGRMYLKNKDVNYYDLYFFRNSKDHWEEVSLITTMLNPNKIVVDPVLAYGDNNKVCKGYQMVVLSRAGLPVPKTIYGSLDYLENTAIREFNFPVILKGSKGDKHRQVFTARSRGSFHNKIAGVRETEASGENRYMLQQYIPSIEDFRIMVVGDRALGSMRRSATEIGGVKDNFTRATLSQSVEQLAVRATQACGLTVGGVDVVFQNGQPFFYEVNRTPAYNRFIEVTGIDVATEVVRYLAHLRR